MERHTLWPVQCMVAETAVLSWWSFTFLSFKPGIFLIQDFIDLVQISGNEFCILNLTVCTISNSKDLNDFNTQDNIKMHLVGSKNPVFLYTRYFIKVQHHVLNYSLAPRFFAAAAAV